MPSEMRKMGLYLRIEVEPLQGVDGVRIFRDVVAVERLDAAEEGGSLDHRQEVGVVQPLRKKTQLQLFRTNLLALLTGSFTPIPCTYTNLPLDGMARNYFLSTWIR